MAAEVTVSQPEPGCHLRRRRARGLLPAFSAVLLGLTTPAFAAGWTKFAHDDGVTVYIQEDPHRELPRFKGVATIQAEPLLILAVLADVGRSCEWNAACVHSTVIETRSEFEVVFHNRLRATWPVSDRDAVLRTGARIHDRGARVEATFDAIAWPAIRPANGVVRFPVLHGRYDIRRIAPGRSHLEYIIDANPGGMIPSWFVRYGVKNVPTSTIAGLRRQIVKRGASYKDFVARHGAADEPGRAPAPSGPGAAPDAPQQRDHAAEPKP